MTAKKNGFTLAELMLVFTVIGILTAILVPALFSAMPDIPKLKAKKAYNTFSRAVEQLINTAPYAEAGSFAAVNVIKYTGTKSDDDSKSRNLLFCNSMVSALNATHVDCKKDLVDTCVNGSCGSVSNCNAPNFTVQDDYPDVRGALCITGVEDKTSKNSTFGESEALDYSGLATKIDTVCNNFAAKYNNSSDRFANYNFQTQDGTLWAIQLNNFSHKSKFDVLGVTERSLYVPVCFNTDKNKSAENTFGLAVNADGKIVLGDKLQTLLDEED